MVPEPPARRPRERAQGERGAGAHAAGVPCPEPEARPGARPRQEAARRNVPACSSLRIPWLGARPSTAPPAAAAANAGRPQGERRRGCPCRRRLRRRPRLAARRYPPSRRPALAPAPHRRHSSRLPVRRARHASSLVTLETAVALSSRSARISLPLLGQHARPSPRGTQFDHSLSDAASYRQCRLADCPSLRPNRREARYPESNRQEGRSYGR